MIIMLKGNLKSLWVWIAPLIMGAVIGAATSISFYVFYGVWKMLERALMAAPKLAFSFLFLSIILSSLPIRMFLKRRPKDSFDVMLEYYHTSPSSLTFKESLFYSLSSFISFAFGAPVGPEGGAIILGAGIAKKLKEALKLEIDTGTILLTGVAAGFTALFKAPLSGFLLSMELPYKGDLEKDPFLTSALASATSYLTSLVLRTPSIISISQFSYPSISVFLIFVSLLFGVASGLFSIFFINVYKAFSKLARELMSLASFPMLILVGGLLNGALGYFFLPSVGPGFSILSDSLLVKLTITSAALYLALRLITTSSIINFGASGGLLLPSIITGALFGYVVGYFVNPKYVVVFVLLGMASLAAGVNKLVLVPVIFIIELVGGSIAIPLVISSIASYFISYKFTIYEYQPSNKLDKGTFALEKLFKRALKLTPEALEVSVEEIMNKNPIYILQTKTVKDAFELLKERTIKVLPVVNEKKLFLGYISIEYLASIPERYKDVQIADLELKKGLTVTSKESLKEAAEAMLASGEDHAFVIDEEGELKGVITEVDIIRYLLRVLP